MITNAQKRAKQKYQKKLKRITVEFYPAEAELVKQLESQPQKQTYIKDLIRKDIKGRN
jgi:hypothetical protein